MRATCLRQLLARRETDGLSSHIDPELSDGPPVTCRSIDEVRTFALGELPETGCSGHPFRDPHKIKRAPMGAESAEPASTSTGAVFLSYASQDAEAAQRICTARAQRASKYGSTKLSCAAGMPGPVDPQADQDLRPLHSHYHGGTSSRYCEEPNARNRARSGL
jgi:hypothetical protein